MDHGFAFLILVMSAMLCAACSTEKTSGELPTLRTSASEVPDGREPVAAGPAEPSAAREEGTAGSAAEGAGDSPEPAAEHDHAEEALSETPSEPTDSCCAAHAAPGCADEAVEACVCADDVLPQCCTEGWSPACVEVVRQRHCDPGVRQCVCTEWEQTSCCESEWTNTFCDTAAELKCGATVGCHE